MALEPTDCWDLVIADMSARQQHGLREYGQPLDPDDKRYDWLVEAYEELLDFAVYLRAEIERRHRVTGRSTTTETPTTDQ
jgi:hypothetical protein